MSIANAFSLLGDVEDDDISTLVAHASSKADAPPAAPRSKPQPRSPVKEARVSVKPTDSGRGEGFQGRGGRGRGLGSNGLDGDGIQSLNRRGSGINDFDGNGSMQSQNKHSDAYQRSYGGSNGYQWNSGGSIGYQNGNDGGGGNQRNYRSGDGYQRNRGTGNSHQQKYGRGSNGNAINDRNQSSGGRGIVFNENPEPQDGNQIKTSNEQVKSEEQNADGGETDKNNDDGVGWILVNKYHGKGYGRGNQLPFQEFRNGNRGSDGDRRGYGEGGNGFRSREGYSNGRRQGLNHGKQEILNGNKEKEGDKSKKLNEDIEKEGDKSKTGGGDACETEENNQGHKEHQINDKGDTGGPEEDINVTNEESNHTKPGQRKLSQETAKDAEGKEADEKKGPAVRTQNQMTLEEYEKQLLERRKNLPALQKNEDKRVVHDKEFESMQRIEKKKDDSLFTKLKAENDKLKRNGSLDKEDKVHKTSMSIDEFLKTAKGGRPQPQRRRRREEKAASKEGAPAAAAAADSVEVAAPAPAPCIEDQSEFPVLGAAAASVA